MSKLLIILACLATLVVAGSANAATSARDPRVPALQHQIVVLQKEITQNADVTSCLFTNQSHFNYAVINVFAALLGEPEVADGTPSDGGACLRAGMSPTRVTSSFHAKLSPFDTLVGLQSTILQGR